MDRFPCASAVHALVTLSLLGASSCAPSVSTPRTVAHPTRAFVEVPYPPPAGLVETVPPVENGDAVWVDGYWNWASSHYIWQRGGWVIPPAGGRLAPWVSTYARTGQLLFASSAWYDTEGRELPAPEPVVPAATPPNEVTEEFQAPR